MREYKGIEIGRIIFACLIPLLHIGMSDPLSSVVKQYVSRLGVPFFFAVTGMFLSKSVEKNGDVATLKKYAVRIGRMLLIWLAIYLPILMLRQEGVSIREILFKTPAYLWYLTALLVASVPFCLVRNRKALLLTSLALYAFGTLFGEAYSWLTGGLPTYESVFITTRNGIFFGLPMMCIGEATWKTEKTSVVGILVDGGVFIAEVTFVCLHSEPGSMYLSLPGLIYFLVIAFRNWNPNVNTTWFGGISSAIYLMQFGVITVVMKAAEVTGISDIWIYWFAYLMVIIVPTTFYLLFQKARIVKMLF
jgi:peptidoglycan/LPS O-acetylase OafA/YrhL